MTIDILDPLAYEFWQRLIVTIFCGGIIGLERQLRGKPAGIRTSILICLGTEIFISLGVNLNGTSVDASRVLGQVVTGIGFIGAGVIMGKENIVKGVTSAAIIWVLAAIGASIGLGLSVTAMVLAVLTVAVLVGVELLESVFLKLRRGAHAQYADKE